MFTNWSFDRAMELFLFGTVSMLAAILIGYFIAALMEDAFNFMNDAPLAMSSIYVGIAIGFFLVSVVWLCITQSYWSLLWWFPVGVFAWQSRACSAEGD